MNQIKGVVARVDSRNVTIKKGPKAGNVIKAFDLIIDGKKYDMGFMDPASKGIQAGSEISFESEVNQYGVKVSIPSLVVHGQGNPVPQASAHVTSNAGKARDRGSFPVPKTSGEFAIIRQNALTNSREVIQQLITLDCAAHDRECQMTDEDIAERVIKMANIFADYSSGHRELQVAQRLARGGHKVEAVSATLNELSEESDEVNAD